MLGNTPLARHSAKSNLSRPTPSRRHESTNQVTPLFLRHSGSLPPLAQLFSSPRPGGRQGADIHLQDEQHAHKIDEKHKDDPTLITTLQQTTLPHSSSPASFALAMAHTPSTPTHNNNGLSDIFGAMSQATPNFFFSSPQLGGANGDFSGIDPRAPLQSDGLFTLSPNAVLTVQAYGNKLGLTAEQKDDIVTAMRETEIVRFGKLLSWLMAVSNKVDEINVAQADFQPSEKLKKNLKKVAVPLLLSPLLAQYKGNGPRNILLSYLKTNRFDLPPNIEHDPIDYDKVKCEASEALTQVRGSIKKAIAASVGYNRETGTLSPPANRQTIFDLARSVIKETNCVITVELCARLALIRGVYMEKWQQNCPGLWNLVDERLASIHEHAKGDATMLTRAFRHLLAVDRKTHGSANTYQIPDVAAATIQTQFDSLIDAAAVNAASTVQGDGVELEGEERRG
uniref:Uncharacterized protein n=1 Tax=Mycena chlorophos TaxID=658473 RepID=A0ABQ0LEF7_MYCCL|nr:predicted protein [Mycena chlorophos]